MAKIDNLTLTIRIGDDFRQLLTFTDDDGIPLDLTGYSFKMQIRECKSNANVILTLESPDDIEIDDAANGNIIIIITDTVTSALEETNAVYDLKWTTDVGQITTILQGNVQILETVTK